MEMFELTVNCSDCGCKCGDNCPGKNCGCGDKKCNSCGHDDSCGSCG